MTLTALISSIAITILPLGGTVGDATCDGETQGWYDGTIYICQGDYMEFAKYHEIGHYLIDTGYFTTKDIETYKKLFERDLKRGKRYFHSEYEMSNFEESFCTDFSLLMTKEKTNIYLKLRIKFIDSIVHN